jgi:hypothetical protein
MLLAACSLLASHARPRRWSISAIKLILEYFAGIDGALQSEEGLVLRIRPLELVAARTPQPLYRSEAQIFFASAAPLIDAASF